MKPLLTRLILLGLVTIGLIPIKSQAVFLADINQDGVINLADAILALQIVTDGSPEIPQMVKEIDVDGDNKIGLAEVVYILRVAAQLIDVTPPVTLDGPSVSNNTATGTTLAATINENGTGHYLVQGTAIPAPSAMTVTAQAGFPMTANVQATVNVSGLTASTPYKIYFVAKDSASNTQTEVQNVFFTTGDGIFPPIVNQGGLDWADPNYGSYCGGFECTYNWYEADTSCKSATINGQTGWRLPTQPELTSLAQSGMMVGAGGRWSSTPAPTPTYHYYISLNGTTGTALTMRDSAYLYVLCVR